MLPIIIVSIIVFIDQITKYLIANNSLFTNFCVIKNFFYITYAENTGMAWSLLSGKQALLSLISAIAIGVMIWYLLYKKPRKFTYIGVLLMIGGAIGNLIDRLVLNYVRDFLNFYIFGYDFPIFNVADCALVIGVIILFIASYVEEKNGETRVED